MGGYYFRRTGDHQPTAAMTSFGAKVNNPVCRFDYVEIMFDDNDRVALISQPVKHAEQLSERIIFLEGVPEIARYDVIRVGSTVKCTCHFRTSGAARRS